MAVWCVLYECDGQKYARYTSVSGVFVYIGAICGWYVYVCSVCIYTCLRMFCFHMVSVHVENRYCAMCAFGVCSISVNSV